MFNEIGIYMFVEKNFLGVFKYFYDVFILLVDMVVFGFNFV